MQQLVTPRDVNPQTNQYKIVVLLDSHLGSRACQANLLLDFLKYNDSQKIYLVGGIEVRLTDTCKAVNGKNYLVMHGDAFDNMVFYARWLTYVGDHAYDAVLALNAFLNSAHCFLGTRYWSLSSYAK